jgi:hypothetical protein
MHDKIRKLASSLVAVVPPQVGPPSTLPDGLGVDYIEFVTTTNGGYTSDNLFHFFGVTGPREHDVLHWNRPKTWKKAFGLDERCFVFAEDVLGNQYYFHLGTRRKAAKVFCIDDGTSLPCADDFSGFIDNVVNSHEVTAAPGQLLADFLKFSHLQYMPFNHLSSNIPARLGGDDTDLENLEFTNSITHLNFMGQLVTQLKNIPEGTVIKDVIFDRETMELKLIT